MHRALAIHEILRMILRESVLTKKDILSVGQTCHILFCPASSILWREINYPALLCLLKSHRDSQANDVESEKLSLRSNRQKQYGQSVRALDMDDAIKYPGDLDRTITSFEKESKEIIDRLHLPAPLFPALRVAALHAKSPALLSWFEVLLTRTLDHVRLRYAPSVSHYKAMLGNRVLTDLWEVIGERSPALRSLSLLIYDFRPSHASVCRLLSRLPLLESLRWDIPECYVDALEWQTIARLPLLRSLDISDERLGTEPPAELPVIVQRIDEGWFCSLKRLCLDAAVNVASRWLAAVPGNLEEFNFEGPCPTLEDLAAFSNTIASQFPGLNVLRMDINQYPEDAGFGHLRPLLSCRNMRTFTLYCHSTESFGLCDADVLLIAQAWHELEHIELAFYPGLIDRILAEDEEEDSLSWSALAAFAMHCPNLKFVEIDQIDAGMPTVLPSSTPSTSSHNHGIELRISYARVGHPIAIAAYLSMLWPCLSLSGSFVNTEAGIAVIRSLQALQYSLWLQHEAGARTGSIPSFEDWCGTDECDSSVILSEWPLQ